MGHKLTKLCNNNVDITVDRQNLSNDADRSSLTGSLDSVYERISSDASEEAIQGDTKSNGVKRRNHATKTSCVQSYRLRQKSQWDEVDLQVLSVDYKLYDYPFENLVFEGGGNKGLAYCGSLKVLEEIGLSKKIKRVSGTSAGAMTAALFAIGYSADDICQFLSGNIDRVFNDHKCGYLSLLPNLFTIFGWNPGKKIYEWTGNQIAAQTGDPNYTFKQLYVEHGMELCIVVTNLNRFDTVYCHVKTTPDMPIRYAVRMSMALPGLFAPPSYNGINGKDFYVDGGLLCNYPIHCFDGWWLSMEKEDGFFRRLQPLSKAIEKLERTDRFGKFNDKTIGFLLYANHEQDIYRTELEKRRGVELPESHSFPDTKLFRSYRKAMKLERETAREYNKVVKPVDKFFEALLAHDINKDQLISLSEFETVFSDESLFPKEHRDYLFGPDKDAQTVFKEIDVDKTDSLSFINLTDYLEKTGIDLCTKFLGYKRCQVQSFGDFLHALQTALLTNVKKIFMQKADVKRTVGINTGYINTTDFNLEEADREFLVDQGRRSVIAFLKYYAVENNLRPRDSRSSFPDNIATSSDDVFLKVSQTT